MQRVESSPHTRNTRSNTQKNNVITLDDSDDDFLPQKTTRATQINFDYSSDEEETVKAAPPPEPVVETIIDDGSEDEFAHFVTKAREAAKRQPVFTRINPTTAAKDDSPSSDGSHTPNTQSSTVVSRPSRPVDPIVLILVTSAIEGTVPLVLKRKLSQRLKDVRLHWCDKQTSSDPRFAEELKQHIFLTWRGNKVFDVTTCKAMGLQVDAEGNFTGKGYGFDPNGRIHLEAWTTELFVQAQKRKQAERLRRAADPTKSPSPEPEPVVEAPKVNTNLKIILKAKDYPDVKIVVKPQTLVSKMINAFRSQNKIPPDMHVDIRFDGDKLEPDSVVADADLEDMTTVEVYVRGSTVVED
jgi:hypothetical protein